MGGREQEGKSKAQALALLKRRGMGRVCSLGGGKRLKKGEDEENSHGDCFSVCVKEEGRKRKLGQIRDGKRNKKRGVRFTFVRLGGKRGEGLIIEREVEEGGGDLTLSQRGERKRRKGGNKVLRCEKKGSGWEKGEKRDRLTLYLFFLIFLLWSEKVREIKMGKAEGKRSSASLRKPGGEKGRTFG